MSRACCFTSLAPHGDAVDFSPTWSASFPPWCKIWFLNIHPISWWWSFSSSSRSNRRGSPGSILPSTNSQCPRCCWTALRYLEESSKWSRTCPSRPQWLYSDDDLQDGPNSLVSLLVGEGQHRETVAPLRTIQRRPADWFATDASGTIWLSLQLMQVVPCGCQIKPKSRSQFLGPLCLWQCFSDSSSFWVWKRVKHFNPIEFYHFSRN